MKKLLGILVLGLLWCNVATSEILDIGKNIEIKIPDNYEYIQLNYKKYLNALTISLDKKHQKELKKLNKKDAKRLGLDGKEIITIIGKEGFGELYSSLVNHIIKKKKGEWEGYKIIEKECGEAGMIMLQLYGQGKTELTYELKKFTKCMAEVMKLDPIFYIYKTNKTKKDIIEFSIDANQASAVLARNAVSINKQLSTEDTNSFMNTMNEIGATFFLKYSEYSWGAKFEFVPIEPVLGKERFIYKISYKNTFMGLESNIVEYRTVVNNSIVNVGASCISKENCNKAEKLKKEIITPFFGTIK